MNGEQSKAQRYAFFAEREASKVAGVPADTKPRKVERVAIIGAGTMGGGISMSFANAGIPVTIIEMGQEQLDRGLGVMKKNYDATAARGGLKPEDVTKRVGLITGKVGLEAAKDADLIIEAVFETMAIKKEVFGKLDAIAKPGAILATNTSYLNIDEIAVGDQAAAGRARHALLQPGQRDEAVRDRARRQDRAGRAGRPRSPSRGASPRSRPWSATATASSATACWRRAAGSPTSCCYEGALPQQIDAVVTKFGIPMGPFTMSDMAGLDIGWRSRKDRGIKSEIPDALCEAGRFGQKTGKGYYKYEGGRAPIPDPGSRGPDRQDAGEDGQEAAHGQRRGNPRAHGLSDGQRGRAHPRREDRGAAERHRRGLALRLWLAGLSRRADVLCRQRRPEEGRRAAWRTTPRRPAMRRWSRAAAAEEARRRGQDASRRSAAPREGRRR